MTRDWRKGGFADDAVVFVVSDEAKGARKRATMIAIGRETA